MGDSIAIPPDTADFEALALPFLDAVAQFARSLTRDASDADDLVQETFLRAFHGWHTYRPGSDPRRWLFTICRHAFFHMRRKQGTLVESDDGDLDAMPAVMSHAQAVHAGLGELFDLIDVRPAIERAIELLPEPHHTILVLVELQDLTYEEVAAILEIPIGTVRSRLFRARRMVQESLIAYAEDAGIGSRAAAPEPRRDPVSL